MSQDFAEDSFVPPKTKPAEPVVMKPMTSEITGNVGYYVSHPEFYCDIEKDANGVWSIYFRDVNTKQELLVENK